MCRCTVRHVLGNDGCSEVSGQHALELLLLLGQRGVAWINIEQAVSRECSCACQPPHRATTLQLAW